MYVCMYVCLYVYVSVCMYVYIYIHRKTDRCRGIEPTSSAKALYRHV